MFTKPLFIITKQKKYSSEKEHLLRTLEAYMKPSEKEQYFGKEEVKEK